MTRRARFARVNFRGGTDEKHLLTMSASFAALSLFVGVATAGGRGRRYRTSFYVNRQPLRRRRTPTGTSRLEPRLGLQHDFTVLRVQLVQRRRLPHQVTRLQSVRRLACFTAAQRSPTTQPQSRSSTRTAMMTLDGAQEDQAALAASTAYDIRVVESSESPVVPRPET